MVKAPAAPTADTPEEWLDQMVRGAARAEGVRSPAHPRRSRHHLPTRAPGKRGGSACPPCHPPPLPGEGCIPASLDTPPDAAPQRPGRGGGGGRSGGAAPGVVFRLPRRRCNFLPRSLLRRALLPRAPARHARANRRAPGATHACASGPSRRGPPLARAAVERGASRLQGRPGGRWGTPCAVAAGSPATRGPGLRFVLAAISRLLFFRLSVGLTWGDPAGEGPEAND